MNSAEDFQRFIQAVAQVLIDMQCYDQCITGSAILMKSLHQAGYPNAYPVSLRVNITDLSDSERGVTLGKGARTNPGKWSGHLAVIVPNYSGNEHMLIDLTVVQINELVPGIEVNPVIAIVDDPFVKGVEAFGFEEDGCEIVYQAFPSDDRHLTETNWSCIPRIEEAVDMVMTRLTKQV